MVSATCIRPMLLWPVTLFMLGHAASIPTLLNTTSSPVTSPSNDSTVSTDLRGTFDSIVSKWKQDNPDLGPRLSAGTLDAMWAKVSNNVSPSKKRAENSDSAKIRQAQLLYRRQNITSSTLTTARALVADAMVQQGEINNQTLSNPRLNIYTKRPTSSATGRDLSNLSSLLTATNSSLAEALPIVAEADAAELHQQGKLYKDYTTITGNFAKYNLPGTPSGSQHNKRDANSWWFPNSAVNGVGSLPFGGNTSAIFRNVLYYGAYGDGIHDDTAAINSALNNGCGQGCGSSTTRGAVVYLPPGTYLVSSPIILYYNTQLVGNVHSLPVIMAAPKFAGLGVLTSDVYIPNGHSASWYLDTNNFYRQVRNFVIDLQNCQTSGVTGIHWQVAQATSLQNIEIIMTEGSTSTQVGIFSENGSGGFMSDILVYGGLIGMSCGNQQFTSRNMIFASSVTGINMLWDWGWTFKSITFDAVQHAIWMVSPTVGGSLHLLDCAMKGVVQNGVVMDNTVGNTQQEQVLITIDNLVVDSSVVVVYDLNAGTFLQTSGAQTIQSWVLGKAYDTVSPDGVWVNGAALDTLHPTSGSLMGGSNGGYFERSKNQYADWTGTVLEGSEFIVGDGKTDQTAELSFIFAVAATLDWIVFIPTGSYIITSTVVIPKNSRVVGSLWSQLVASGTYFQDMENPKAMIQVGKPGDFGSVELQDLLFTATGPTAGVVLLEWNIAESSQGAAAMWDCHFRVGGATGTGLQVAQCPITSSSSSCIGASLMFHVTSSGNGYFENIWAWSADHDIDDPNETQVNVFTGRGTLIESTGPSWFYASASEHAILYQYNIANAENIFMGMIQSESPYYAPLVNSPGPFKSSQSAAFTNDPDFSSCQNTSCEASWALIINNSDDIQIMGAGLYSWYANDYSQACVDTQNCQQTLVDVQASGSIYIYNLYTIGSVDMITPGSLNLGLSDIVTAKANSVENAHPFVSALNTWTSISPKWVGHQTGSSSPYPLCLIGPSSDSNALVANEASQRHIAAYLDSFISANGAKNLAANIWQTGPKTFSSNEVGCDELSGTTCPEPSNCATDYGPVDEIPLYWVQSTLYTFNQQMQFWGKVFGTDAFVNITNMAPKLISDFPVQLPVVPSTSALLGDFGSVLSIIGAAVTVNPEFDGGAIGGAVLSTLGGIVSAVAAAGGSSSATDASGALADHINQLFAGAKAGIQALLDGVFVTGDMSQVNSAYTTGTFGSPIANYFDKGNFLYILSGDQQMAIGNTITTYLEKNLVGFLLTADNWWILQDAYTLADCPGISSGQVLNGHCYTLETFGTGWTSSAGLGGKHNMWSVPASSDTLATITGYGVSLTDLYTSSVNCQQGSVYGGSVTLDYSQILASGLAIPTCFYSLPVFYVRPSEDDITNGAFADNPCALVEANHTASGTPIAGTTFLPANLVAALQDSNYCCVSEAKGSLVCANHI